jgi:hypothetical protein
MPSPRPNWPGGKEPINGGLWLARGLIWLMVVGTMLVLASLACGAVYGFGRISGAW